jgi:hypothetical protein
VFKSRWDYQQERGEGMFFFAWLPAPFARRDVPQQKQLLAAAFAVVAWEVPRLLESMWDTSDFYFDRVAQIHIDRWSDGRVGRLAPTLARSDPDAQPVHPGCAAPAVEGHVTGGVQKAANAGELDDYEALTVPRGTERKGADSPTR